ncbi:MAG: YdjY domain-containing protein [Acidobacteriota bacterium]
MHARRPLIAVAVCLAASGCRAGASRERPVVRPPSEIEFPATVHARAFDSGWMMPGYHAVVARGGRMAHAALLEAEVSDVSVVRALESLGAAPGNNLSMDAWRRRRDSRSPAPDATIAGPAVDVLVRIPGRAELVPLSELVEDRGGRGLDLRFGGNERLIPEWRSGCIVCLYSCPGSKIGNARYTERDYVRGATRFRSRASALPPSGTRVGVVVRLRAASPAESRP